MTAELALGLPLLLAVTLALVWLLSLASAQVRVVDAAREAARAVARGDAEVDARARARTVAPGRARIEISRAGDEIVVSVATDVQGPGGLLEHLPAVTVAASAHALAEES